MTRWSRFSRPVAGIVVMVVIAGCSVSTPRGGWTEGAQAMSAGTRVGSNNAADLAPGESPPAGGETDTGTGSVGGSGSGTVGRTSGGGTATRVGGASEPTVGVTDKTITVSFMAGFSGAYGSVINQVFENGVGVWAQEMNDHGGINGRQIVLKKVDNKDTVEGGVAACKTIQNNGSYLGVSVVALGGADVAAVDCLDKAGITTIAFSLSTFSPRWTHAYSPTGMRESALPVATFIQNVMGERDKIGVIYIQNEATNRASRVGLLEGMQEIGMSPVHEEGIASGQNSFVAELNRMRSSGATTVAIASSPTEALGILRDAKSIAYSPKWVAMDLWQNDEWTTVAPNLIRGIKGVRKFASVDSPAYKTYVATAKAQGRTGVINSSTFGIYGMAAIVGRALQNAGPTPTAANLGPAIESIVNYDDGITHLSFGKGVHVADVGMWPIECCNADNTWHGIGPAKNRF